MAPQQSIARKQSRSKGESNQKAESQQSQNGHDEALANYEQELAEYLLKRIKPGLNRGAIPLLARSIAHEVAQWEPPDSDDEADDDSSAEADAEFDQEEPEGEDESSAEADAELDEEAPDAEAEGESDDEDDAELDEEAPEAEGESDDEAEVENDLEDMSDFEAEMRDLQGDLGEDWIVRFSVQGDDAWLTAEKEDGSQRLEAPDASVLFRAVKLLAKSGGRST